jgi:hypothetical protein
MVFQGEGFALAVADTPPKPHGFYTARWALASCAHEAERHGRAEIEAELRAKQIDRLPDAWIRLDEIAKQPLHRALLHALGLRRRIGFAFFALDDDPNAPGPLRTYVLEQDGAHKWWRPVD